MLRNQKIKFTSERFIFYFSEIGFILCLINFYVLIKTENEI